VFAFHCFLFGEFDSGLVWEVCDGEVVVEVGGTSSGYRLFLLKRRILKNKETPQTSYLFFLKLEVLFLRRTRT
jgi:hypothetical protein